ncbi:MAG: hypothetical protein HY554_03230 [Elusimicrobia bacterium]|nr:hypothetical protein [Elusimicrobiota bacterium]
MDFRAAAHGVARRPLLAVAACAAMGAAALALGLLAYRRPPSDEAAAGPPVLAPEQAAARGAAASPPPGSSSLMSFIRATGEEAGDDPAERYADDLLSELRKLMLGDEQAGAAAPAAPAEPVAANREAVVSSQRHPPVAARRPARPGSAPERMSILTPARGSSLPPGQSAAAFVLKKLTAAERKALSPHVSGGASFIEACRKARLSRRCLQAAHECLSFETCARWISREIARASAPPDRRRSADASLQAASAGLPGGETTAAPASVADGAESPAGKPLRDERTVTSQGGQAHRVDRMGKPPGAGSGMDRNYFASAFTLLPEAARAAMEVVCLKPPHRCAPMEACAFADVWQLCHQACAGSEACRGRMPAAMPEDLRLAVEAYRRGLASAPPPGAGPPPATPPADPPPVPAPSCDVGAPCSGATYTTCPPDDRWASCEFNGGVWDGRCMCTASCDPCAN